MGRRRGYKPGKRGNIIGACLLLIAIYLGVELGVIKALSELVLLPLNPNQAG